MRITSSDVCRLRPHARPDPPETYVRGQETRRLRRRQRSAAHSMLHAFACLALCLRMHRTSTISVCSSWCTRVAFSTLPCPIPSPPCCRFAVLRRDRTFARGKARGVLHHLLGFRRRLHDARAELAGEAGSGSGTDSDEGDVAAQFGMRQARVWVCRQTWRQLRLCSCCWGQAGAVAGCCVPFASPVLPSHPRRPHEPPRLASLCRASSLSRRRMRRTAS